MWFRNPFAATKPGTDPARRRTSATRLAVEALEDRSVPASLSISQTTMVMEGVSGTQNAEAIVRLSQPSNRTVTVDYYTRSGTGPHQATAGSDYTAVSGRLTFAPGETQKSVLVPIHGDRVYEGGESFSVNLQSASSGARIANGRGIVTIVDNNPELTTWGGEALEADGYLYIPLYLSSAYDLPVTVDYYTCDGTAVAGQDYVATSGTVTFAPGETSTIIAIPLIADTTLEPDEWFYVRLSNSNYAWFPPDYSVTVGWIYGP